MIQNYRKLKIRTLFNLELSEIDNMNFQYNEENSIQEVDKSILDKILDFEKVFEVKQNEGDIIKVDTRSGEYISRS